MGPRSWRGCAVLAVVMVIALAGCGGPESDEGVSGSPPPVAGAGEEAISVVREAAARTLALPSFEAEGTVLVSSQIYDAQDEHFDYSEQVIPGNVSVVSLGPHHIALVEGQLVLRGEIAEWLGAPDTLTWLSVEGTDYQEQIEEFERSTPDGAISALSALFAGGATESILESLNDTSSATILGRGVASGVAGTRYLATVTNPRLAPGDVLVEVTVGDTGAIIRRIEVALTTADGRASQLTVVLREIPPSNVFRPRADEVETLASAQERAEHEAALTDALTSLGERAQGGLYTSPLHPDWTCEVAEDLRARVAPFYVVGCWPHPSPTEISPLCTRGPDLIAQADRVEADTPAAHELGEEFASLEAELPAPVAQPVGLVGQSLMVASAFDGNYFRAEARLRLFVETLCGPGPMEISEMSVSPGSVALNGQGVGSVTFGASYSQLAGLLESSLGAPTGSETDACGSSQPVFGGLTIDAAGGVFNAWILVDEPTLRTTAGITIGSTRQEVIDAYGAVVDDGPNPGEFILYVQSGPDAGIFGFIRNGVVSSLTAGVLDCPDDF